jgi:hypothetical protein
MQKGTWRNPIGSVLDIVRRNQLKIVSGIGVEILARKSGNFFRQSGVSS